MAEISPREPGSNNGEVSFLSTSACHLVRTNHFLFCDGMCTKDQRFLLWCNSNTIKIQAPVPLHSMQHINTAQHFPGSAHVTTHKGNLNLKGQLKNTHSECYFFFNVPWQPTFAADFQFAAVAWLPYLEVLRE